MRKILFLLAVTILLISTATGCSLTKEKGDIASFEKAATDAGMKRAGIDPAVEPVDCERYISFCNEDVTYYVQFYDFKNVSSAEKFIEDSYEAAKENSDSAIKAGGSMSLNNYTTKTYSVGDEYFHIANIDDTVLYAFGKETEKDEIKEFFETVGY